MDQRWNQQHDNGIYGGTPRYTGAMTFDEQQGLTSPTRQRQDPYSPSGVPGGPASRSMSHPVLVNGNSPAEDVNMDDAEDPYNSQKYQDLDYPSISGHRSRPSSQYIPQPQSEESAAARRYSPMKLSPTSPDPANANRYTSYTPNSTKPLASAQTPTRPSFYPTHSQSYHGSPSTFSLFYTVLLLIKS